MFRRTAVAAMISLVLAIPAHAQEPGCRQIRGAETPTDPTDDVSVCRQDVWVHKAGARLGNLAGLGQDAIPSWDTTTPTGSLVTEGGVWATSAVYDVAVAQDPVGRAVFAGSFTGALDTLAFQVYLRTTPLYEVVIGELPTLVKLTIDGQTLYETVSSDGAIRAPLKPAGNVRRVDVAFVNLYRAMGDLGLDLTAQKEHTVRLELVPWFIPDSDPTVIFYDAAEAPTGLIFNLEPQSMVGYTQVDLTVTR